MKNQTQLFLHSLVLCTNILVRKDEKYILLERSLQKRFAPGVTHPFGGKVDKDEDPLEATLRELKEEAGIEVKNVELRAVITEIHHKKDFPANWLVFYFTCDYVSGDLVNSPEGKSVLLDEKEIETKDLFPTFEKIKKHLFKNNHTVKFYKFHFNNKGQISSKKV